MNEQMKDKAMKTRSTFRSFAAVARRRLPVTGQPVSIAISSALTSAATLLCLLAGLVCTHAQDFALDWFSIDGGGGTSTGGVYAVSGTIGQPDAGVMQGGQFALQGGFWSILASGRIVLPSLHITRADGQVIVTWDPLAPGFVLEENTSLSPTGWSPVPGGDTSPVTLSVTTGSRFFRLRR